MKNRVLKAGLYGMALFLTGAVAVSTIDKLQIESRLVDSPGALTERYLRFRAEWAPLVPPSGVYEEVAGRMSKGDWSFLSEGWFFTFDGEVLYVPEKSELASMLKLPARVQIREDLRTGQIYLLSAPLEGKTAGFEGLAAFDSPSFMPYEKEFPLEHYLFDELSPRRVVWEVILKPESDAWNELFSRKDSSASELSGEEGGLRTMSVPENLTELWLQIQPSTNGSVNLLVYAPEGFTNRVEIYSCTNLVTGGWEIAAQNLYPESTNPAVWAASASCSNRFFRAGNMDVDSDGDGIPDARERMVYKTDPYNADTDGDGMPDGWEIEHGFNPLLYADGGFDSDLDGLTNAEEYFYGTDPHHPDTDGDGMPDDWEVAHGLNPLVDDAGEDADGDGVTNLQEYLNGTHPQVVNLTPPSGSTGSLLFRYDDDGRLTESHLNSQSSELYSLSPAHNVEGLNMFTTAN